MNCCFSRKNSIDRFISCVLMLYYGGQLICCIVLSNERFQSSRNCIHEKFVFVICRNCLIGQGYTVKISDFAMFRPAYSSDYFKATENGTEISPSNTMAASSQSSLGDLIALRWIPWEVYVMVRICKLFCVLY